MSQIALRGLDRTSNTLPMAFAHDVILEVLLTRGRIDLEAAEATLLSPILVEHWQRRYGDGDQAPITRRRAEQSACGAPSGLA